MSESERTYLSSWLAAEINFKRHVKLLGKQSIHHGVRACRMSNPRAHCIHKSCSPHQLTDDKNRFAYEPRHFFNIAARFHAWWISCEKAHVREQYRSLSPVLSYISRGMYLSTRPRRAGWKSTFLSTRSRRGRKKTCLLFTWVIERNRPHMREKHWLQVV